MPPQSVTENEDVLHHHNLVSEHMFWGCRADNVGLGTCTLIRSGSLEQDAPRTPNVFTRIFYVSFHNEDFYSILRLIVLLVLLRACG